MIVLCLFPIRAMLFTHFHNRVTGLESTNLQNNFAKVISLEETSSMSSVMFFDAMVAKIIPKTLNKSLY